MAQFKLCTRSSTCGSRQPSCLHVYGLLWLIAFGLNCYFLVIYFLFYLIFDLPWCCESVHTLAKPRESSSPLQQVSNRGAVSMWANLIRPSHLRISMLCRLGPALVLQPEQSTLCWTPACTTSTTAAMGQLSGMALA